jgi:1,4-dihydroxy-2-naphthoyl-CoA synthase
LPQNYCLPDRLTIWASNSPQEDAGDKKQAVYNLFAAYLHTVPLEELIESVERARRDAQLKYVVIYGAACSYCLGKAQRLDGSYLRTFALELKEQLSQTLTAFVT